MDDFGDEFFESYEPNAWCPDCKARHQWVRPGKTQPTCDCHETCPKHGRNKVVYHAEGEFPLTCGYFCAECWHDAHPSAP